AGYILKKDMPLAEQRNHQQVNSCFFPHNHTANVLAKSASCLLNLADFVCLCHSQSFMASLQPGMDNDLTYYMHKKTAMASRCMAPLTPRHPLMWFYT